jgi:hypothetical protein
VKNIGFLALALLFLYGGYRYVVHTDRVKADSPEHPVGSSPIFLLRALGVIMALCGGLFVYLFFKALSN